MRGRALSNKFPSPIPQPAAFFETRSLACSPTCRPIPLYSAAAYPLRRAGAPSEDIRSSLDLDLLGVGSSLGAAHRERVLRDGYLLDDLADLGLERGASN